MLNWILYQNGGVSVETKSPKPRRSVMAPARVAAIVAVSVVPVALHANGLWESQPWQFQTPSEKSVKAGILDVIERKKAGYYDGYTIYNTTNIGTQINCTNSANTNANIADNGQTGPQVNTSTSPAIDSSSGGSINNGQTEGGLSSSDVLNTDQDNSGTVVSTVSGTDVGSSLRDTSVGGADQDLTNDQTNSGTLSATVSDSAACSMDGGTLQGSLDGTINIGPLN